MRMNDICVGDVFASDYGEISVITEIRYCDYVKISYVCKDWSTISELWPKSDIMIYFKKVEI